MLLIHRLVQLKLPAESKIVLFVSYFYSYVLHLFHLICINSISSFLVEKIETLELMR